MKNSPVAKRRFEDYPEYQGVAKRPNLTSGDYSEIRFDAPESVLGKIAKKLARSLGRGKWKPKGSKCVKKHFECSYCNLAFHHELLYNIHFLSHQFDGLEKETSDHNKNCLSQHYLKLPRAPNRYFCDLCPTSYDLPMELQTHRVKHFSQRSARYSVLKNLFICFFCGIQTKHPDELVNHLSREHCRSLWKLSPSFLNNQQACRVEDPIRIKTEPLVGKPQISIEELSTETPPPPYQLQSRRQRLKKYSTTVSYRPEKCHYCGKQYRHEDQLYRHIHKKHGRRSARKRLSFSGVDVRAFRCTMCKVSFQDNYRLIKHVRYRHEYFGCSCHPCHGCALCSAKFYHNHFLRKHVRLNHLEVFPGFEQRDSATLEIFRRSLSREPSQDLELSVYDNLEPSFQHYITCPLCDMQIWGQLLFFDHLSAHLLTI